MSTWILFARLIYKSNFFRKKKLFLVLKIHWSIHGGRSTKSFCRANLVCIMSMSLVRRCVFVLENSDSSILKSDSLFSVNFRWTFWNREQIYNTFLGFFEYVNFFQDNDTISTFRWSLSIKWSLFQKQLHIILSARGKPFNSIFLYKENFSLDGQTSRA